jgi:hypothetical protein
MKLVVISRTGDRSQVLHNLKNHTDHQIQSQVELMYFKIWSHLTQTCIHKQKETAVTGKKPTKGNILRNFIHIS